MDSFDYIWELLFRHGGMHLRRAECQRVWNTYSQEQQRQIYATIKHKLEHRRFVHYDPVRAIQENVRQWEPQHLTMSEYYARFGTTEEQGGWKMTNPTGNKVIYVKQ